MSSLIRWQMNSVGSIDLNIIVNHIFGVPLFLRDIGSFRRYFVIFYFIIFTVLFNIFYVYFELFDLVLIGGNNFSEFAQNACLTITHIGGDLKLLFVVFRLKDIISVIEKVQDLHSKFVVKENHRKIFYRSEIENKLILLVYLFAVMLTAILGVFTVVTDPTIGGRLFPYRAHLPEFLPLSVRISYWSVSAMLLALQIVSIDSLFVNLINNLRCHLKLLNINLQELTDESKLSRETVDIMKKCITHHQIILELKTIIDNIFKYPVLMQFILSLFIMVLTGFEAVVLTESGHILVIYLYSGCILTQLFVYCWFANQATEENKFIALSAYNTSWIAYGPEYSKMILIFMINSQKPFVFTAGGFFDLSLASFSGLLSRSYSYIAILRQVYSN